MNKNNWSQKYNFPDSVHEYTSKIIDVLIIDKFFEEEEISQEIFYKNLGSVALEYFLSGEALPITEKEMLDVITHSAAESVLESLREKGMLDSFPDENGEEHYFLTEEGKMIADIILDDSKKNVDESNHSNTSKTV